MSRRPTPRPPRSAFITAEGRQRLEQEYQRLWSVERPKLAREVGEAAALGDRSENAEYIYGKRRLREIGVVRFGAWVELAGGDGQSLEYQIVGPDEFDVEAGRISMDSPLGAALLGKCCGDEVAVRRPKGDAVFEITGVRYRA